MTRIPRFRFKDRPKPNPIRIQNVFVDPPIVPINVAQPGEPGGGGTPASNPAIADNLVPRGLRPVAVFPPYLFPRTVPAQCLIFLEPDPPKKRPVYGKNIVICSSHFFRIPNFEFFRKIVSTQDTFNLLTNKKNSEMRIQNCTYL